MYNLKIVNYYNNLKNFMEKNMIVINIDNCEIIYKGYSFPYSFKAFGRRWGKKIQAAASFFHANIYLAPTS